MRRIAMSVCLLLTLLGGAGAVLAPAASAANTQPNLYNAEVVVVEDIATITYSTNRSAKESLRMLTCTLDGTPADCGEVAAGSTKKSTNFSVTYSGLTTGPHIVDVSFLDNKGVGSIRTLRFDVL